MTQGQRSAANPIVELRRYGTDARVAKNTWPFNDMVGDSPSDRTGDDNSGEGNNALLKVAMSHEGLFYIAVSSATGTYTVQVKAYPR